MTEKNTREKKISKKEMFEELGFGGVGEKDKSGTPEHKENILINEEPFTDIQFLETLKNRRDVADLVIENIEKNVGKLQLHREKLKMVTKFCRIYNTINFLRGRRVCVNAITGVNHPQTTRT